MILSILSLAGFFGVILFILFYVPILERLWGVTTCSFCSTRFFTLGSYTRDQLDFCSLACLACHILREEKHGVDSF